MAEPIYVLRDLLLFRDNPDLCSHLFNMDDIACFIMGVCTGRFTDAVLGLSFISVCMSLYLVYDSIINNK